MDIILYYFVSMVGFILCVFIFLLLEGIVGYLAIIPAIIPIAGYIFIERDK